MVVFRHCNPAKPANLLGKPCMGMMDMVGLMKMVVRTWRNGGTMQGGGKKRSETMEDGLVTIFNVKHGNLTNE